MFHVHLSGGLLQPDATMPADGVTSRYVEECSSGAYSILTALSPAGNHVTQFPKARRDARSPARLQVMLITTAEAGNH
jgi:hypothetical protein